MNEKDRKALFQLGAGKGGYDPMADSPKVMTVELYESRVKKFRDMLISFQAEGQEETTMEEVFELIEEIF